ncbi:MAG: DsbA family protein [Candidatus Woesebacteria bacterium]|nr:DsbA family protein [Candidatus Woesebacteria bacterium]
MENEEKIVVIETVEKEVKKSSVNQNQIAGAIIIAGLLIAGALLLKGNSQPRAGGAVNLGDIKIKKVSLDEHILGNPNAKVTIIEYSDTECPFCKRFHNTMNQVIKEKGNEIAWVYRHFPIAQLHPKAFNEAVAMECAWEQGGNDSFWKYTNELFVRTESNNKLDALELPKIAQFIGLELVDFNTCLNSEKYGDKVRADMKSGDEIGVNGTPKSFILKKGKVVDTIEGAYPYEQVLEKINKALK